jgi:hypothetical protein
VEEAEEGADLRVAGLDAQEAPAVGIVRERADRRGEVVRARAASVVARADRGVLADLLVSDPRVPEEVARRVDADQHRAVDALRIAPDVDQGRSGALALAEQVDPAVPEGAAHGLEIVDALGQRVAGEVDALTAKALGAIGQTLPVRVVVGLSEQVAGLLHHRLGLGAVEHRGAVDAAVADEHDVAVAGEAACVRKSMLVRPGPPWSRKTALEDLPSVP